ncbi:hypothetical protein BJ138DRAFT_1129635 [Hygrophoropsis aurantiaca]|uniref:Uncharacterized protein n=1 Tax=Hygrophoropsis aurantiaca TaxID=72124 RepID=A0ACB8A0A7_9AGAM|nr:hypothetical protein BJ138DRAFT_1129635 [Hygrophoropsis aurantiaca]
MANIITLQAPNSPIASVEIFKSGVAEISRYFSFDLPTGESQHASHTIEVVGLPKSLHSLRVSISYNDSEVDVLDYHKSTCSLSDSELRSDLLQDLKAKSGNLMDERRLRQQGFKFLATYMESLAEGKSQPASASDPAQIASFFDDFVEIGKNRSALVTGLESQIADIQRQIADETERLRFANQNLCTKVIVVPAMKNIGADAQYNMVLKLVYCVKDVSWEPTYDLRLTAVDGTPTSSVKLQVRAKIRQNSGEAWNGVNLSLSSDTSSGRHVLRNLPNPKIELRQKDTHSTTSGGIYNSKPAAEPQMRSSSSTSAFSNPSAFSNVNVTPASNPLPFAAFTGPGFGSTTFGQSAPAFSQGSEPHQPFGGGFMHKGQTGVVPLAHTPAFSPVHAQPSSGKSLFGTSLPPKSTTPAIPSSTNSPSKNADLSETRTNNAITYTCKHTTSIPSDNFMHQILVATIPLEAVFMHITVPSVDSRVFLCCQVLNSSAYPLFPTAKINTFMNEISVSEGDVYNDAGRQIIESCLKVDELLATGYDRSPEVTPSIGIGMFPSQGVKTYRSTIIIRNSHPTPVRGIIIRDSVPVPADSSLSVTLKEPEVLARMHGGGNAREGVDVRWSSRLGANEGKREGGFEWVCDVLSGGEELLKAVWEISGARDVVEHVYIAN